TLVTRKLTRTVGPTAIWVAAVSAAEGGTSFFATVSDRCSFVVLAADSLCRACGLHATNTAPAQSNQMTKRELIRWGATADRGGRDRLKRRQNLRPKLSTPGRAVKGGVTRKL